MRNRAGLIVLAAISVVAVGAGSIGAKSLRATGSVVVTSITAAPGHQHVLQRGRLNVVYVHPGLAFNVALRNDGTRRNAQVTLAIMRRRANAGAIVERKTVAFAPGARTQVKFNQLQPVFAQRETLKLTVVDRAHREVWATTYPVIFALG
jgi:hypothetical protein